MDWNIRLKPRKVTQREWTQVLHDCADEMGSQLEQWGVQCHHSILEGEDAMSYVGATSDHIREVTEQAFVDGTGTWANIALEEFAEALDAPDETLRRGELVQLMAVVGSWIESIDMNERYGSCV